MGDSDSNQGRPRKIPQLIDEYGLAGIGSELEARRIGDDTDPASLRDIAYWFNRELLGHVMREAGMDVIPDEVNAVYDALVDESVSSGNRTQLRRKLSRAGIDVERLKRDFVSRQAVHTYLTKVRDAERPGKVANPVGHEVDSIRRLVTRTEVVTEDKLSRLREHGDFRLGEFRCTVDVVVHCLDCGTRCPLEELIQSRGCRCEA